MGVLLCHIQRNIQLPRNQNESRLGSSSKGGGFNLHYLGNLKSFNDCGNGFQMFPDFRHCFQCSSKLILGCRICRMMMNDDEWCRYRVLSHSLAWPAWDSELPLLGMFQNIGLWSQRWLVNFSWKSSTLMQGSVAWVWSCNLSAFWTYHQDPSRQKCPFHRRFMRAAISRHSPWPSAAIFKQQSSEEVLGVSHFRLNRKDQRNVVIST